MPTLVRAVFPALLRPHHPGPRGHAAPCLRPVLARSSWPWPWRTTKKTLFTLDERLAITRQALADMPNVRVEPFEGLVTEFAVAHHAQVMVRGLRSGTDFDYELQLASMEPPSAPAGGHRLSHPRAAAAVHQQHPGARNRHLGRRRRPAGVAHCAGSVASAGCGVGMLCTNPLLPPCICIIGSPALRHPHDGSAIVRFRLAARPDPQRKLAAGFRAEHP